MKYQNGTKRGDNVGRPMRIKRPSEIVRNIRGERTLKEFGDILGVTFNTVYRIESGIRNVSIKNAYKLVEICGGEYKIDELLKRNEAEKKIK